MGKQIIISGADFSENSISIPMVMRIKAGQSVVIDGITYSGGGNGTTYELDYVPNSFRENSAVTYLESVIINDKGFFLGQAYFQYQNGLERVEFKSAFKTTNNLNAVFSYCGELTEIDGLENISTEGVGTFSAMFRSCSKLAIVDLTSLDTSSATTLENMFAGCAKLTSLDLSSFDTSNVTSMTRVFSGCTSLATLTLGEDWDMVSGNPSITDMFYNCNVLHQINAPNCNISDVNTEGTQLYALVHAIEGSSYTVSSRPNTTLEIICSGDNKLTGTYTRSGNTGSWSWA